MSKKINYDGEDRLSVARATLRIVGAFAGTEDVAEWMDLVEAGTAEQCEAKVTELSEQAQQNTLNWGNRKAAIVMEVLSDNFLADDFMRMERGTQAGAFEPGGPRTDCCGNCGAPRDYVS